MSLKLCIRAVNQSDVDTLAALNVEVQELHFASRPDEFKPAQASEMARWFVQLLHNPAARLWGAEVDGTLVGYVVVLVREKPENPFCPARRWWDIDQIGVSAGHRRAGVGRELVQRVVSEARAVGIRDVELNTWAFNQDAQRAFMRLGFAPKTVRFELRTPATEEGLDAP